MRFVVVLVLGSLTGCGGDAGPSPPTYDLAWNSCAGTRLAGTCVEAFFEPFVACFQPTGHCTFGSGSLSVSECWDSGADFVTDGNSPSLGRFAQYRQGKTRCMSSAALAGTRRTQYCLPADSSCAVDKDDGGDVFTRGGALYDLDTGIFTCPDGTEVDVGPNLGDCAALNALLAPACDHSQLASCS